MPSRLVENLYWFGRYTARCEDKTRLLRGTLAARSEAGVWRFAVKFCRELGVLAIDAEPSAALRDDENPFGIVADLRRLGWCASQVRSRLSASCWRAVGELQRALQPASVRRDEPREALDRLLLSLAALAGFALDEMTQDEAWRLLRIGRRLERLQFLARLLARHLTSDSATQQSRIEWLLEACDSLRVYRPRYAVAPRLGPTLDLLIRDVEHPRALAFQAHAIARDLAVLAASFVAAAKCASMSRSPRSVTRSSSRSRQPTRWRERCGPGSRRACTPSAPRRRSSPTASRCGTSHTPAWMRRHSPREARGALSDPS